MRKYIWLLVTVFTVNCGSSVFAQVTFSPYTINGIGDISSTGLANNFGMGDIGIATPSYWYINNINPALLVNNSLTVFQMGVAGESRNIDTELTSEQNGNAGLKYIAFAFPVISGKWSTSFGILPYSTVAYNITSEGSIDGSEVPIAYNFKGEGGTTRVYFANGFTLFKKIDVGFRASYLFGLIENETTTNLGDATFAAPFPTAIFEKTDFSGAKFTIGAAYKKELKNGSYLNFGAIYESKADLDGERFIRLERRTVSDIAIPGDTLAIDDPVTFNAPSQFGIGIAWEKLNHITVALDIKRNNWSRNPEFGDNLTEYTSTTALALGVEWVPDYTNVNSYFKRIKYRLGVSLEKVPYMVQNKNINDFGINFGWSLPVGASSVDMGFKYGQRGTVSDNLIRERYFKFVLGATINDRWFVRRKYD